MNKNELSAAVAEKSGLSKTDAAAAVDGLFDVVTSTLAGGGDVRITGFGTFHVTRRQASMGRNPRTGEPVAIPASNQAKFKAGKGLKDSINS